MELRFAVVHRVTTIAERRSHKHELFSFQRQRIKTIGSWLFRNGRCRSSRHGSVSVVCGANLLSLAFGLLYHHLVVLLQVCTFNDSNDGTDIVLGCGIAASLDASSPSFVIIRREIPGVLLIAVAHEDFAMILIALANIIILLELLIRLVIVRTDILTIELTLHTKMVIGSTGEHTLSLGRLYDSLGKSDRSRYAISAHLLHGILCILIYISLSGCCHFLHVFRVIYERIAVSLVPLSAPFLRQHSA